MREERLRPAAAAGLVIGALLGMAGSFAPSAALRGLAWAADGIALIVASALLAVHHLRRGDEQLAAGFLVFLAGETLIISCSAMDLAASAPTFAAGAGLWAAALALVSASRFMPGFVRATGAIAALLLAVTAAQIFGGRGLTPLSQPLPFYGYPFLAVTLIGWAWVHKRSTSQAPGFVQWTGTQSLVRDEEHDVRDQGGGRRSARDDIRVHRAEDDVRGQTHRYG